MKRLSLGSFSFNIKMNSPQNTPHFPQFSDIPFEITIDYILKDNIWGRFIQFPNNTLKKLTSYYTGVKDSNNIINIVTETNSILINETKNQKGDNSVFTTITPLDNQTYEIITKQSPGFTSKSITHFSPLPQFHPK